MRAIAVLVAALLLAHAAPAADIHDASREGDLERVRAILAEDPDQLTARSIINDTPLHVATTNGHAEVVRLLLERGAPVDVGDNENSTALDCASIFGHLEIAEMLLAHGADPSHADDNGMTPLHFAVYNGREDVAALLIENGADVGATRVNGSTPLHGAAYDGSVDLIRLMLEHGGDVNLRNAAGFTPVLSAAAGTAERDAIELLVEGGADIHDRQFNGENALMFAASAGKTELADYLLEIGMSANAKNDHGWTALHFAVFGGHADVVASLLQHGADVDARDGGLWTALFGAAHRGHHDIVVALIEGGADVNARSRQGETALMMAFNEGHVDLARALIENGADVNAQDDNWGRSILHGAALRGWRDMAELALESGADVSLVDADGMTPLSYAGKYGHPGVADLLKANGAVSSDLEENYGRPALLDRRVGEGQASMWYLGHCGWAVKTEDHFLIFDYWNAGSDPAEPSLTNGHIVPSDLEGESVYVFVTHEHRDHYDPVINGWDGEIEDLTYVFGFRPELMPGYRDTGYVGPAYEYVGPREFVEIDDLDVRTIEANDAGVGFLVEVDGVSIFHAGDHAGWAEGERDGYFAEIDYLAPFVSDLDLAFVNVTGCHAHDPERLKEGNVYAVETLAPKILIPTHAAYREYAYRTALEDLAEAGVTANTCCPSNRGDSFFYDGGSVELAVR